MEARHALRIDAANHASEKALARLGAQAARLHRAKGTIDRVGKNHLL
jgi:hypothetical protein